jgi:RNA polymerase sigma-70 factor (ECF subfamily)
MANRTLREHPMQATSLTSTRASGAAPTDAELLERAGHGDAAAFELIMRRHNRLLFRSARGVLGDDAEAQDVVQETYLRAFARLETFRGESALATWLARIAINLALDAQRRRGRAVPIDDAAEFADASFEGQTMASDAPSNDTPDAAAERGEVRVLLQRAIDRLPPIYRSVFMLRAVEEMSVEQTAACLQVSDAVVKTRYLRARALLRDALGAQIEPYMTQAFSFAGARCDAVVAGVLESLQRDGRLRDG